MGFQMMLMTMRSIVMMKIMEIRMTISYIMYSLNSNALLFTTNILRVDAYHALGVIAMKKKLQFILCRVILCSRSLPYVFDMERVLHPSLVKCLSSLSIRSPQLHRKLWMEHNKAIRATTLIRHLQTQP